MHTKAVAGGLLAVIVGGAAFFLWPSEASRVRARVLAAAAAISGRPGEGDVDRLARLAGLAKTLSRDIVVEAEPGGPAIRGREAVAALATQLATAGEDGTIRYWSATDGSAAGPPVAAQGGAIERFVCSQDGVRLASSGDDGRFLLWQVGAAHPNAEPLEANDYGWQPMAFNQDGSRLAFVTNNLGNHLANLGEDGRLTLAERHLIRDLIKVT